MKEPIFAVILPVFNESEQIAHTLERIDAIMRSAQLAYKFIIVDDGSRDATWTKLQELQARFTNITALRFSRNFGKEAAICAALELMNVDACILIDADLQHPPELIPQMVEKWREGYEVVEGVKQKRGDEGLVNRLGAKAFYYFIKRLSGLNLDAASDFKLLDYRVVQAWRQMPERNVFFRGMTSWLGFKVFQLPFEVQSRVRGSSKWSKIRLAALALNAITAFSSLPMQMVTILGVAFLLGSLALGLQTLYMYWSGAAFTGFTTVILLLLFIGSIIMISLGVIGTYLAKVYDEVKRRPRYLVCDHLQSGTRAED